MNIISVHADNGACTIVTPTGRFERWPGRKINGRQWWSYTPLRGHQVIVTVPETIAELEAEHAAASPRRLQVVA